MKALRFRWHGKRRVWYGYTDEETARAAINNAGTEAAPVAKVPAPVIDKAELRRQFEKAWDSPKMVDYCVKKVAAVEELAIIRAAVQSAATAHEKRVETYLKRYGTSKVHTWTYWRDA